MKREFLYRHHSSQKTIEKGRMSWSYTVSRGLIESHYQIRMGRRRMTLSVKCHSQKRIESLTQKRMGRRKKRLFL